VYGSIDATTPHQAGVGSIDDGVGALLGDIALDQ
jgi:hypothetical protein